jgi:hypothetical protein
LSGFLLIELSVVGVQLPGFISSGGKEKIKTAMSLITLHGMPSQTIATLKRLHAVSLGKVMLKNSWDF